MTPHELHMQLMIHPHPEQVLYEMSDIEQWIPCDNRFDCGWHLRGRLEFHTTLKRDLKNYRCTPQPCGIRGHQRHNVIAVLFSELMRDPTSPKIRILCEQIINYDNTHSWID
jgi:hypothetical protein